MSAVTAIELVLIVILHPLERVLRLGGVRVRLGAPHAPRRARRRGQPPCAHGAQDRRRPVALHRGVPARHHALLDRARRARRAGGRHRAREPSSAASRPGPRRAVSVAVALILISILHVVLGEIVPKSYTLPRAEQVALSRRAADRRLLLPLRLVHLVPRLARGSRHAHARHPVDDQLEGSHSEVELRMLLRQGERAGVLEADEQEMIDKVFDFSDTPVEHVMVPRPDIVALRSRSRPRRRWSRCSQHPYTRYPVYDEEFDNVLGVLHVRRLFVALQNGAAASTDLRGAALPGAPRARDQAARPPAGRDPAPEGPHGDRRRRVRLGRRPRHARGPARGDRRRDRRRVRPRGRPDRAPRAGSLPRRGQPPGRGVQRALRAASSRTRTTTRSAASSSASSAARRQSATASRSATSSSTSRPSTARASCTPTRRCCRCPSATRRRRRRRLVSYRPARGGAGIGPDAGRAADGRADRA